VCAAESRPKDEDSVRLLALALLMVLVADGTPAGRRRRQRQQFFETAPALADKYGKRYLDLDTVAGRYGERNFEEPPAGLVALLDGFGAVRATGHPDAEPLARAVAAFAASGAPRSIDQVAQLKVSLSRARPPIWRRVLLPSTATLGDLHDVIQVLFGWDGDHLHMFDTGKKRYSDPFARLEETGNEETIRVRDAMAPGGTIAYTYDFGADWHCKITLEKMVRRDHSQQYPVCAAFQGDSPVEYWDEERPRKPTPFGLEKVNRRLAGRR
jgi:hypothetical protein